MTPVTEAIPSGLRIRGISKKYPGTVALDNVDLDIRPGEIHALLGGNGSGKSTLIKIVCGVVAPEPGGVIEIGSTQVSTQDWSRDAAHAAGVHAVHQDLGVFLDLTVGENLAIGEGFPLNRARAISWPDLYARAARLIERFMIDATPITPMRSLSQANRALVAIARAVQDGAHDRGLLILDEPTAALPAQEADLLLETLRRYAAAGQSILYVSHRLEEITRIADRATVLRDGISIGTFEMSVLDEAALVRLIVGSDLAPRAARSSVVAGKEAVLELQNVRVGPLRDVDLTVGRGEIVGVAGLVGSGRSSLLRAIFGVMPFVAGTMSLSGKPLRFTSCGDAISHGVAYVSENRADDGAFSDLTVAANIVMPFIRRFLSAHGIHDGKLRATASELMASLLVKAPSPEVPLMTLSGGNQQKVMLARWLGTGPKLLLLDEPTQGVDVGARAEIHGLIREAADDGLAVIVVASDPEELANLVDRAIVLRAGRIAAELQLPELSADRLATEIHHGQREG